MALEHALMVHGVPEEEPTANVEETLQSIKALGRVRVRGKMFDSKNQTVTLLCECREVIDPSKIPPELIPPTGETKWTIVIAQSVVNDEDTFTVKLAQFLQDEGKTMDDIQTMCAPSTAWNSSPESIIRAVGEVLNRSTKPTESNNYRRLKTFSGVSPVPLGEECLDGWLEQAKLMVEECECTEKEKRRRLVESLKGPALEIIQAVRLSNPDAKLGNTFRLSKMHSELQKLERTFICLLGHSIKSQGSDCQSFCGGWSDRLIKSFRKVA